MFAPYTEINADPDTGRTFSRRFELKAAYHGDPEGVYESCGEIESDAAANIVREYIELGENWKTLPVSEKIEIDYKLLQTGDAKVLAHFLGKQNIDTAMKPGYTAIGLSHVPQPAKIIPYQLVGKLDDGQKIIIQLWRGQAKAENTSLVGKPGNPPSGKIVALIDSTRAEEISRGVIYIQDKVA